MIEELTKALSQEELEEREAAKKEIATIKKTILAAVLIGLFITFFMLAYFEWIHPYPNQYRIVTNGDIYRVQEKNWFFPWCIYDEYDGYYGSRTRRFYSKEEAQVYMDDLEDREARRMAGKEPNAEDEWKPIKGE